VTGATDLDELRARAAELREGANVSQRAMARFCGCAQSVLAGWESGRITAPGVGNSAAARKWWSVLHLLALTADGRTDT
jgi:transcriptional regulator with XRE-family HTH domain